MLGGGIDAGTIRLTLAATDALSPVLARSAAQVRTFSQRMQAASATMVATGRKMTMGLTLPIVGIGAAAVKGALDYERSMTKIRALVGVQTREYERQVLALSEAVGKSPQELAEALYYITSAGQRGAQAMRVLEASAKASAAGLGEVETIADAVTSAVNAYGQANLSASLATDILVATVREGKMAPEELAASLGRVVAPAEAVGIEFHEVGAAMAILSRVGLDAAESATALRGILMTLLKPSKQAQDALAGVGLTFTDLRRSVREEGLFPTLVRLRDLLYSRLGADKAAVALASIFPNVRALNGVLIQVGRNMEANAGISARLARSAGDAQRAFDETAQTAHFRLEQALAKVKVQMVELGLMLMPTAERTVSAVRAIVGAWEHLPEPAKRAFVAVAAGAALLGPFLALGGRAIQIVLALVRAYRGLAAAASAYAAAQSVANAAQAAAAPVAATAGAAGARMVPVAAAAASATSAVPVAATAAAATGAAAAGAAQADEALSEAAATTAVADRSLKALNATSRTLTQRLAMLGAGLIRFGGLVGGVALAAYGAARAIDWLGDRSFNNLTKQGEEAGRALEQVGIRMERLRTDAGRVAPTIAKQATALTRSDMVMLAMLGFTQRDMAMFRQQQREQARALREEQQREVDAFFRDIMTVGQRWRLGRLQEQATQVQQQIERLRQPVAGERGATRVELEARIAPQVDRLKARLASLRAQMAATRAELARPLRPPKWLTPEMVERAMADPAALRRLVVRLRAYVEGALPRAMASPRMARRIRQQVQSATEAAFTPVGRSARWWREVSRQVDEMLAAVGRRVGKGRQAGQSLADALAHGVRRGAPLLQAATSGLLAEASSAAQQSALTAGLAPGMQFAAGMAQGIAQNSDAVEAAARQMVQRAVAAVRDAQESRSPSRVTRRHGRWYSQGYALGIDDGGRYVQASARRLVAVAEEATRKQTDAVVAAMRRVHGRVTAEDLKRLLPYSTRQVREWAASTVRTLDSVWRMLRIARRRERLTAEEREDFRRQREQVFSALQEAAARYTAAREYVRANSRATDARTRREVERARRVMERQRERMEELEREADALRRSLLRRARYRRLHPGEVPTAVGLAGLGGGVSAGYVTVGQWLRERAQAATVVDKSTTHVTVQWQTLTGTVTDADVERLSDRIERARRRKRKRVTGGVE